MTKSETVVWSVPNMILWQCRELVSEYAAFLSLTIFRKFSIHDALFSSIFCTQPHSSDKERSLSQFVGGETKVEKTKKS